jgi:hypothetical protein
MARAITAHKAPVPGRLYLVLTCHEGAVPGVVNFVGAGDVLDDGVVRGVVHRVCPRRRRDRPHHLVPEEARLLVHSRIHHLASA